MRLSKVSFRYARREPWVLREVDLGLRPGEIVELTGRNGAGKSTLLKLLAGVLRPTGGSVTDRPAVVGYAPEIFPPGQPFTVAAYLSAVAAVRGVKHPGDWPERLGMTHLLQQRLGDLSKGSAHKVGLAQALLAGPGLLVLDEPFAGLDTRTRAELPAIIQEIADAGGIVVTGDHQGGLRGLPSRRSVSVVENRVIEGAYASVAIIEVTVDAAEATEIAAKLRADGYPARVRDGRLEDDGRPDDGEEGPR